MATNKTDKVLNVPTLRFPGFTDEWETLMLSEIAPNISAGRSGNPIENGDFYLYGSTGIIGKTNNAQYQGEKILIARVGANAGKISYNNETCGITDNTLIVKSAKISARYLYYYLTRYNLNRLIFGSGQPLITGGMLKKIPISFPELIERNKIISFLSLLDERIALQSRLIDRLKSLMDGIIDKVTAWTPNISIAECLDCYSSTLQECETEEQGTYPVYGANGVCGYLNYAAISDSAILIVKDGSGVGNVSYTNGDCSVVGTLNYLMPKKNFSAKFLYFVLKRFNFQPYKTGMAIPHIYFKAYSKARIFCPDYEEQSRTAAYLSRIEDKIALEERLLCLLQEQKHYLLSAMFI